MRCNKLIVEVPQHGVDTGQRGLLHLLVYQRIDVREDVPCVLHAEKS